MKTIRLTLPYYEWHLSSYILMVTFCFFFPSEQTRREDHRLYLEKSQHLQRRWPVRYRGLKAIRARLRYQLHIVFKVKSHLEMT